MSEKILREKLNEFEHVCKKDAICNLITSLQLDMDILRLLKEETESMQVRNVCEEKIKHLKYALLKISQFSEKHGY